ncbi:unnamed protein product [Rhizophagus irregularis]|nr:unnamed protein product [Rhizophagus irregularis]
MGQIINTGLLGKFALENFDEFFDSYKEKNSLASDALLALSQFLIVLNEFFDLDDDLTEEMIINNTIISWYSYTNMAASGDCVRAVSKYYNEPEFSNVSINMNVEEAEDYNTNEGTCFGKVLMLVNIVIKNYSSFDLALVRWYNFRYNDQHRLYKYDCPLLKLTNEYNFIPVESIVELVQVIQRTECQNEYFVNVFLF